MLYFIKRVLTWTTLLLRHDSVIPAQGESKALMLDASTASSKTRQSILNTQLEGTVICTRYGCSAEFRRDIYGKYIKL